MIDHIERFSTRVENYICYRPGYPEALIDLLERECSLPADSVFADVGSGTGILSELFLKNGNVVYRVEANGEMILAWDELGLTDRRWLLSSRSGVTPIIP